MLYHGQHDPLIEHNNRVFTQTKVSNYLILFALFTFVVVFPFSTYMYFYRLIGIDLHVYMVYGQMQKYNCPKCLC